MINHYYDIAQLKVNCSFLNRYEMLLCFVVKYEAFSNTVCPKK